MPPRFVHQTESDQARASALVTALALAGALFSFTGLFAQGAPQTLRPSAIEQLRLLSEWKAGRTAVERRIDSQLLFALDRRAGRMASGLAGVGAMELPGEGSMELDVELTPEVPPEKVAAAVRAMGGEVGLVSPRFRTLRVEVAPEAVLPLAGVPGVRRIAPARPDFTQQVVSEGDRTHAADRARNLHGFAGAGIKICAISNGIDTLADSQERGELPEVAVLPGQAGDGDEGTAMLEILHDVAPEALLGFATARGGVAQFAQNILDLAASGCRVIVDDVFYIGESPFHDGPLAMAVDEVAAQGVLYLSSAGNVGNFDDGTSGTWQGDFVAGAAVPALPGMLPLDFGAGEVANLVLRDAPAVTLHWPDPYATSANDYDVYVLAGDLSHVLWFSNNSQDGIGGDDDPGEIVSVFGTGASVSDRIVVVRFSGENRLLNLAAFRGRIERATHSAVRGHAAAVGAIAVAAAPAAAPYAAGQPSGPYPQEFDATQQSETFSADGPRRIFYGADGGLLPGVPPGDFSSTGGLVREKPEVTAADGVSTTVEGYREFYGTSAAAPHAAALAAVYWSALPSADRADVRTALLEHALDIELPGPDVVTGRGLVALVPMLAAASVPLVANLDLGPVSTFELSGNGDAVLDPGERWRLEVALANVGGAAATGLSATLASAGPWSWVQVDSAVWPDLAAGEVGTPVAGFEIAILPDAPCGVELPFHLTASYAGGMAPETLPFGLRLGVPGPPLRFAYGGPPVFIADSPQRGIPGPEALAEVAIGDLGGRVLDLDLSLDGELCTTQLGATTVGIEHPFVSNLQVELVAPSGRAVPLIRFADGFGNHFCQTRLDDEGTGRSIDEVETPDMPFTGTFRPTRELAQFDGEDPAGVWTLRVTDWNPLDVGRIRAFSLHVTPAVCSGFRGIVEVPALAPSGAGVLALLFVALAFHRLAGRRSISGRRNRDDA